MLQWVKLVMISDLKKIFASMENQTLVSRIVDEHHIAQMNFWITCTLLTRVMNTYNSDLILDKDSGMKFWRILKCEFQV